MIVYKVSTMEIWFKSVNYSNQFPFNYLVNMLCLTLQPPRGFYYSIYAKGIILTRSQMCYFYEKLLVLNDIKVPNIVPQIVFDHKIMVRKLN